MRILLSLALLALVGCTAAGPNTVSVSNRASTPATVVVTATDTFTRSVEFTHTFLSIPPSELLSVSHQFRDDRSYRVNVSVMVGENATLREGEDLVEFGGGYHVTIHVAPDGTFEILRLAAD